MSHACHCVRKCHKTLTFCSLLTRWRIPCACHTKRRFNIQKWREHVVLCFAPQRRTLFWTSQLPKVLRGWSVLYIFWLGNVLRATTTCTFSTSQLPKVIRTWGAFSFFTCKCASRHNGVHFFDIATSKSAPNRVCFLHFDLDMCFAPQQCATFHLSFDHMARHPPHFSEPTFRPSGATNHWKNTVNRDFSTFSHTCIFCLLTLSLFWSSFFCSSLLWLFPPLPFHLSILSEVWLLNFLRIYRYQSFVRSHSFRAAPLWKSPCPLSCLAWDETSGNGSGATNEGPKDPKSFMWENQL